MFHFLLCVKVSWLYDGRNEDSVAGFLHRNRLLGVQSRCNRYSLGLDANELRRNRSQVNLMRPTITKLRHENWECAPLGLSLGLQRGRIRRAESSHLNFFS